MRRCVRELREVKVVKREVRLEMYYVTAFCAVNELTAVKPIGQFSLYDNEYNDDVRHAGNNMKTLVLAVQATRPGGAGDSFKSWPKKM